MKNKISQIQFTTVLSTICSATIALAGVTNVKDDVIRSQVCRFEVQSQDANGVVSAVVVPNSEQAWYLGHLGAGCATGRPGHTFNLGTHEISANPQSCQNADRSSRNVTFTFRDVSQAGRPAVVELQASSNADGISFAAWNGYRFTFSCISFSN